MIAASVVICTHNRARVVERAVQAALDAARLCVPAAEVLVVDNASTDDTARALADLDRRSGSALRVLTEPEVGLSAARNRGLAAAAGDVVVFLDDDAVPRPGWLQALVAPFAARTVVCVGGPIVVRFPSLPPPWYRPELASALSGFDLGPEPRNLRYGRTGDVYPYGANIAFRVTAARGVGGFSRAVGLRGAELLAHEETDLCYRLEAAGGEIRYTPDAVVDHWVLAERLTPEWFLARFEAGGRSAAAFVLRNRGVLRALWRVCWLYGRALLVPRHGPGHAERDPLRFARECRRREAIGYLRGLAHGMRGYRRLRADGRPAGLRNVTPPISLRLDPPRS